ncbi:unnamed protein product, partial [Rotaria sp. Silwood1]
MVTTIVGTTKSTTQLPSP